MSKHFLALALLLLLLSFVASQGEGPSPGAPQVNPAQVCGSFVTNVSMTVPDRLPLSTPKSAIFSFTTQTPLAYGDSVTILYPRPFFSGSGLGLIQAQPGTFLSCCNPVLSAQTSGTQGSMIFSVGTNGAPPGPYQVTITGLTLGAPTAGFPAENGISIATSKDLRSAKVPTGPLGDQVTAVNMNIGLSDRIPKASNKSVTGALRSVHCVSSRYAH
jgi:hypothetical protein